MQDTYTIKEVAALFGIGERTLFREMRDRRILDDNNLPTPPQRGKGRFIVKQADWDSPVGPKPYGQTRVTVEGVQYLRRVLREVLAA